MNRYPLFDTEKLALCSFICLLCKILECRKYRCHHEVGAALVGDAGIIRRDDKPHIVNAPDQVIYTKADYGDCVLAVAVCARIPLLRP